MISPKAKLINKFLISDWYLYRICYYQSIAHLINTPKKILNNNYQNYSKEPIEIATRNIFGNSFEVNDLNKLVQDIKNKKENFKNLKNDDLKNKIRNIFFN